MKQFRLIAACSLQRASTAQRRVTQRQKLNILMHNFNSLPGESMIGR